MLTIAKQPGADTRVLTDLIVRALDELKPTLPRIVPHLAIAVLTRHIALLSLP